MAVWRCGRFAFDMNTGVLIMGICNVTPDSFSDGAAQHHGAAATEHGQQILAQGGHIIDVGGESTRPGYTAVPEALELERVLPVIAALAAQDACVSIDSHKPAVMRAALAAGAAIVNDVNALHSDGALELMLASDCGIVIMDGFSSADQAHKRASVSVVQRLAQRHSALIAAGVAAHRLVIDPGIGFDKCLQDNLECIRRLPELKRIAPVLIGGSRKSMLGAITGQPIARRKAASVALALLAAQRGASVLRVHDVQATADAIKVWQAVEG